MEKNKKRMFIDIVYEYHRDEERIRYSEAGRDKRIREKYKLPFKITDIEVNREIKKALKNIPLISTEYFHNGCRPEDVTICLQSKKYSIKDFIHVLKNTKNLEYVYNNIPLQTYRHSKNKRTGNEHLIAIIEDCKYKRNLYPCTLIHGDEF